MKPTFFTISRILAIALIIAIPVTLLAFQQKDKRSIPPQKVKTDTIPATKKIRDRKIVDLDEALNEIDRVDIELDLKELDIELSKIGPEIERELAKAKIEIDKAVKEINVEKINEEINASLKEIDIEKIQDEIKESLEKIDLKEINEELKNLEKINLDEVKNELKKIKPELEKELGNVSIEVKKAKAELKEYKTFVDNLERDGLINKKGEYSIKHKNGELIINGKTQPAGVYNKHRSFLEKHKTLTIEKSDDDFRIDHDSDDNE